MKGFFFLKDWHNIVFFVNFFLNVVTYGKRPIIPHLLTVYKYSVYKGCMTANDVLFVFFSCNVSRMAAMLSKFRIDYSDVIVITDITKKPQKSTRNYFDSLTKNFVKNEEGQGSGLLKTTTS